MKSTEVWFCTSVRIICTFMMTFSTISLLHTFHLPWFKFLFILFDPENFSNWNPVMMYSFSSIFTFLVFFIELNNADEASSRSNNNVVSTVHCSDVNKNAELFNNEHSRCPDEAWMAAMALDDVHNPSKVLINVGMNKGYNFAIWMNVFSPITNVTPKVWADTYSLQPPEQVADLMKNVCGICGCCGDCTTTFPPSSATRSQLAIDTTYQHDPQHHGIFMVGVEMNNKTAHVVKENFKVIKKNPQYDLHGVKFHVIYAAGSNYDGLDFSQCQLLM